MPRSKPKPPPKKAKRVAAPKTAPTPRAAPSSVPRLLPTSTGVRVAIGAQGSGKTYGIMRSVIETARAGVPVIVLDRMGEWERAPRGVETAEQTSIESAARAVDAGARLIIVHAPRGTEPVDLAEEACAWACDYDGLAGVAIPEAQRVAPSSKPLPETLEDCVTQHRHHRVALWCDTQRFALLNRNITDLSTELRLYAFGGEIDLARARELGGKELEKAIRECARRLISDGEAGWHVRLSVSKLPPFVVTREPT